MAPFAATAALLDCPQRHGRSRFAPHTRRREKTKRTCTRTVTGGDAVSSPYHLGQPTNRYLATASSDHTVKIWNVDGFKLERTLVGHQRWVWDCLFSVDGAYLTTASSDTTARMWTLSTGEAIRVYQGYHKATVCCALHDGAESAPS